MAETRKLLDAWLPPEGVGRPIACIATTFTFDADFFQEDCLARFLGLDLKRDESSTLAYLIEQEEKLAEARATVIADRGHGAEGRSLRWDLVTVGVRGGIQHAKVTALLWEGLTRFVVSSANLVPAGYRNQVETAFVLDAVPESGVPRPVFAELASLLRDLVGRVPGSATSAGPRARASETLRELDSRISGAELPERPKPGLRVAVVRGGSGTPIFPQLQTVWQGGPARWATVLSPYFDAGEADNVPAQTLASALAARGPVSQTYIVPVDFVDGKACVHAPKSIERSVPRRVDVEFRTFKDPDPNEERRLHGKAMLLESDSWVAALVGSSNFTSAGLGLGGVANVEANIAIGARANSPVAKQMMQLFSAGDALDLDEVQWEPEPAEDEPLRTSLPLGFAECLLRPLDAVLELRLHAPDLPREWRVTIPIEETLVVDSSAWASQSRPSSYEFSLADDRRPPFVLQVSWSERGESRTTTWPVNVADASELPPPEELRALPVSALLEALASTRPMHEALERALAHYEKTIAEPSDPELDALKRYAQSNTLFHRARRLSAALAGLRRRLERPAANADAFEWRLRGPFGPVALAKGFIREMEDDRTVEGEVAFALAELALTLARTDWSGSKARLSAREVNAKVNAACEEIVELISEVPVPEALAPYVSAALAEVRK